MSPSRTLVLTLLVAAGLFASRGAVADSDGYYCANDHYFAYQFDFSKAPRDRHILTIIWLADDDQPIVARDVDLGASLSYGMKCSKDAVEILTGEWVSAEKKHYYHVALSDEPGRLTVTTKPLDGNFAGGPPLDRSEFEKKDNLGDWSGVWPCDTCPVNGGKDIPLSPPGATNRYFLHIYPYVEPETIDGQSVFYAYAVTQIVKKSGSRVADIFHIYSRGGGGHSGE